MSDFQISTRRRGPSTKFPTQHQQLMEMGFDNDAITSALEKYNGDLIQAQESLIEGGRRSPSPVPIVPKTKPTTQIKGYAVVAASAPSNSNAGNQNSTVRSNTKTNSSIYCKDEESLNKFIRTYKVKECKERAIHDKRNCMFWHTKADRRRSPYEIAYICAECPNLNAKTGTCPDGDNCLKTHNMLERMFHPELYKITMCQQGVGGKGPKCERGKFCAFAHSDDDHRIPSSQASSKQAALAAAAAISASSNNHNSTSSSSFNSAKLPTLDSSSSTQDKLLLLIQSQGSDGIISSELPKRYTEVYGERLELTDDAGEKIRIKDLLTHPHISMSMHKGVQPKYVYTPPPPGVGSKSSINSTNGNGNGNNNSNVNTNIYDNLSSSTSTSSRQPVVGTSAVGDDNLDGTLRPRRRGPSIPLENEIDFLNSHQQQLSPTLLAHNNNISQPSESVPGLLNDKIFERSLNYDSQMSFQGNDLKFDILGGNNNNLNSTNANTLSSDFRGLSGLSGFANLNNIGNNENGLLNSNYSSIIGHNLNHSIGDLNMLRTQSSSSSTTSSQSNYVSDLIGSAGLGDSTSTLSLPLPLPPTQLPPGYPSHFSNFSNPIQSSTLGSLGGSSIGVGGAANASSMVEYSERLSQSLLTINNLQSQLTTLQSELAKKNLEVSTQATQLQEAFLYMKRSEEKAAQAISSKEQITSQFNRLSNEVATLRETIAKKTDEVKECKETLSVTEANLAKAEQTKNSLVPELKLIRTKLATTEAALESSREKNAVLERERKSQSHEIDSLRSELALYRNNGSNNSNSNTNSSNSSTSNSNSSINTTLQRQLEEAQLALAQTKKDFEDFQLRVNTKSNVSKPDIQSSSSSSSSSTLPASSKATVKSSSVSKEEEKVDLMGKSNDKDDSKSKNILETNGGDTLPICVMQNCGQSALYVCTGCNSVRYCGQAHQREHWKTHKKTCNK